MSNKLPNGFYWVQRKGKTGWTIGCWNHPIWVFLGIDGLFADDAVGAVGDAIDVPPPPGGWMSMRQG